MRPHVTKAFTVLGLALVAWGVVVFIGRSSALQSARQTIADQKEENAAKVEAVYRLSRELIRQESLKVEQAEREMRRMRAQSTHVLDSAQRVTASSMAVLQDSAATVPQLRSAFGNTVRAYDALAQQFRAYLMSDSTYHSAIEAERVSVYRLLTLADSTIVAKNEAIQALRKVGSCTIVWRVKCPTRTTSFVLGAIATGAVVIALR